MKRIEEFECEKCGARYDSAEKAAKCENSHLKPLSINSCHYRDMRGEPTDIPFSIFVDLEDGSTVLYSLGQRATRPEKTKKQLPWELPREQANLPGDVLL